MSTVLLLSTADTDLLAARAASGADYRIGNPTRVDVTEELPGLLDGADIAVVRLLGGHSRQIPILKRVLKDRHVLARRLMP